MENEFFDTVAAATKMASRLIRGLEDIPTLVPLIPDRYHATLEVAVIIFVVLIVVVASLGSFAFIERRASQTDPKAVVASWTVLAMVAAVLVAPVAAFVGFILSPFVVAISFAAWHWFIALAAVVSVVIIVQHKLAQRAKDA